MLDGLLFQPPGTDFSQQTRAGIPIYRGGAQGFEEWRFKIQGRVRAIENQCKIDDEESQEKTKCQLIDLSAKVVEALQDDALQIAIEIGLDSLSAKDGVSILIKRIEEAIPFGDKEDDARDLYHVGAKKGGVLSRQKGESMVSYIARRRRWWQKLKSLDASMNVSESILADYLLMCSGLDSNQRLMIKTAIGSSEKNFTTVASFLRKHHPTIHEDEHKTSRNHSQALPPKPFASRQWKPRQGSKGGGKGFPGRFAPNRFKKNHANITELDDDDYVESDDSDADASEADEDATAYACHSCAPKEEFEDIEDAIEQDIVCAFMAADCDLNDKPTCEDIADAVHNELVALVAREQAQKRGVETSRVVHQFRPPTSELSLDQRRAKVALAKKNSTCRRCGQSGHWAADPQCPMLKKSDSAPHRPKHDGKFKKKFRGNVSILDGSVLDEEEFNPLDSVVRDAVPASSNRGTVPVPYLIRETVPVSKARGSVPDPAVRSTVFVDSDDEYIANMHDGNEYDGHECAGPARFPIADRGPNAYPEVEYAFPDNDAEEFEVISREDRSVRQIDDPIFKFGQYKAHTYRVVAENDAGYFFLGEETEEPVAVPLQLHHLG